MPSSALRPCPHAGCTVLVVSGRCAAHERQRHRQIDERRGSSAQRGYGSRWQKYRAHFLRQHPLCGDQHDGSISGQHSACVRAGRVTAATEIDHTRAHQGDQALFWDVTNHQSLCHSCHSTKTASEDGGFGHSRAGGGGMGVKS